MDGLLSWSTLLLAFSNIFRRQSDYEGNYMRAGCFCFYDLSKMLPNKKRADSKHIVRMGPECYNSSRDNIIYGGYYISDMTYPGRRQRE